MTAYHLRSIKRGLPEGHVGVCRCGYASPRLATAAAAAADVADHVQAKAGP